MSSSPASESVFAAGCPLQVATGDHPLVAVVEPERAVVVATPEGTVVAEIGLREEAEGVDVAWLGLPPRLLVVSRFTEYTLVHLLDVTGEGGARMCAEKRVELPMRLFTVCGAHGLLAGTNRAGIPSTAILTRADDHIHIHPVAARGIPSAAGALGTQLVLAFAGMIEIWDPVDRVAKRRIKLPRPVQMNAIGGSDRQIWLTTITDPQRLEVIPLVNRGQPRAHELPETISSIASHPKLDVLIAAGADSGKLYVIDLDGRMPTRDLSNERFGGRPMAMGLVGGRAPAIIAVASGQPPRAVWLDGSPVREWPPPPEPPKVHFEPTLPDIAAIPRLATASSPTIAIPPAAPPPRPAPAPPAATVTPASSAPAPGARPTVFDSMLGHSVVDPGASGPPSSSDARGDISNAATRIPRTPRPPRDEPAPSSPHAEVAPPRPPTLAERLDAWRERVGEASAHTPPLAEPDPAGPAAPRSAEPPASDADAPASIRASATTSGSEPSEPPAPPVSLASSGDVAPLVPEGATREHSSPALPLEEAKPPMWLDPPDHALVPRSGSPHAPADGPPASAPATVPTVPMMTTPRAPTEPGVAPWSASEAPAPSAPAPPPLTGTPPPPPLTGTPPPPPLTGTPPPPPLLPPEPPAWFVPSPPAAAAPSWSDSPPVRPSTSATLASSAAPVTSASAASAGPDWRRALIEWAPAAARGQGAKLPLAPPFTSILARLALGAQLGPALQLLYACHLVGHREVPPADVAAALTGLAPEARWREALGTGVLGDLGLVVLRRSNLRLCGAALRVLDDRPPRYGLVVGRAEGFPRDRSAAVVIDGADPSLTSLQLAAAAATAAATPVLAVTRSLGSPEELRAASLEARLRGALAAISFPWPPPLPTSSPALYLAPTREEAESTGFEVLTL